MKRMLWAWIGALLLGFGIVRLMNTVSSGQGEPSPVFSATEETFEMEQTP